NRWGAALFTALLVASCAELLGLDAGDSAGGGGRLPTGGGATRGGASGALSGAGGRGGGAAGEAGRGDAAAAGSLRGGSPTRGGSGGSAGSSVATGGSGSGAEGGDGSGGENPFPEFDSPCENAGAIACRAAESPSRLLCDGTVWTRWESCDMNFLCDRETGACRGVCSGIPGEKRAGWVTCTGYDAMVCGPDGVNPQLERCVFGCTNSEEGRKGGCHDMRDDQMLFHPPIPIISERILWEKPLIPVCFVGGGWTSDEVRTIRDAADAAWGRFTAVGFSGWTSCDDAALDRSAARVELRRVTGCGRTLAQMPRTGFPGPGAVLPIDLCLSYYDATRASSPNTDGALLAAISVHVFGHVLGFPDERHDGLSTDVMMEGVTLTRVSVLSVGQRLSTLHAEYGAKPAQSLVHRGGRCLSAVSGGALAQKVCDGTADQAWRLASGRIAHVATNQCLRATGGTSVGLGSCTSAETWTPASVEWRHGNYCISVRTTADANAPLGRESCTASRAADQRWRFEFLADDRVRIRLARDGRCVLRPEDWTYPTNARLGACDGARDIFEIRSGRLEMSGRCLNASTPLNFVACSENPAQRFAISGMLQNDLGALTLADSNGVELTVSVPASSPPQTFDYQL
ncbi:MAG TPA: hypothetical protein VFZ53_28870, partial [Polyangiaceae bacterium]